MCLTGRGMCRDVCCDTGSERCGQVLLFDAAEVARVWREWFAGMYDEQLGKL